MKMTCVSDHIGCTLRQSHGMERYLKSAVNVVNDAVNNCLLLPTFVCKTVD